MFTAIKCPTGFTYSLQASACPVKCSNKAYNSPCYSPNRPGCVCPADKVELGNKCVSPDECQCLDRSFRLHKVGRFGDIGDTIFPY